MGGQGSGRKKKYATAPVTNVDLLFEVAKRKGFRTQRELLDHLVERTNYHKTYKQYYFKIRSMAFTYRDIILISDALRMTPAEFIGVWFPNMFQVEDGEVIMKVPDDVRQIVLDRLINAPQRSAARHGNRYTRKRYASEVADFLKTLE